MSQADLERLWRRRATVLARRCNLAWWLERFNALALGGLLLFSALILAARTARVPWIDPALVGGSLAGLLAACSLVAWWLGQGKFVAAAAGLVRLEDRLGLHNRLSAASAGIGPWPDPANAEWDTAAFPWNPARAWLPGAGALALVAAAWWMPLPQRSQPSPAVVEPSAWERMEDWLATLREEALVEEESIEDLASRIEELRDRPEAEWFSHSSLEATDTLQQGLGLDLRDFAAEMNALERSLAALQSVSGEMGEMGEEAKDRLAQEFSRALEALAEGGLPPDESLLRQLREIDPAQLGEGTIGKLSPGQLQALQQRLREGSGALGSMEGLPELGRESLLSQSGTGLGEGPGRGGIDRGRGDAPLSFGQEEDPLGTSKLEGVTNDDFSRAKVGEVLGLGETERELERTPTGPVAGGAASSTGRGGEAVSRETLLPDEQAVLKRYFK